MRRWNFNKLEELRRLKTELETMVDIDNQIEQLQGKHEEKEDIQDDIAIIDLQRKKARRRNSQEQAQQRQTQMNDLQQQLQQLDGSVDVRAKTSLHKLIHRHEPLLLLTNDSC